MNERLDELLSEISIDANASVDYAALRKRIEREQHKKQERRSIIFKSLSTAAIFILLIGFGSLYIRYADLKSSIGSEAQAKRQQTSDGSDHSPVLESNADYSVASASPDSLKSMDAYRSAAPSLSKSEREPDTYFLASLEFDGDLMSLLPESINGVQRKDDDADVYFYEYEDGAIYTVLLDDSDITDGTDVGSVTISKTADKTFIALWRITQTYTVSVSGKSVTKADMEAFMNAIVPSD